jgi:light-regulated signal transduction histidine kinase (bacteriophytochrome)
MEEATAVIGDDGIRITGVISENARRMAQLIDDLLALSRVSRTEMQSARIDMKAMAAGVFEELVPPERRARIAFSVEALPPAMGDPTLLRQVWTNLIANAIKFSSKRERATIGVSALTGETEVTYIVRDNGIGFQQEYAHKLFKVFQRLHSTREFEGTGVGLAIVQRLVQRHGGRVWAESEPNHGAAFSFALPRKPNPL